MPTPNVAVVVDTSSSRFVLLRPHPVNGVTLEDAFWAPRRLALRNVTLPSQFEQLEQTGRLDNFRRAAGKQSGSFQGLYFNDSDVYKWLEASSWALADGPDVGLEQLVDVVVQEVAEAQQPDGYLDTYYQVGVGAERWTELQRTHELYCAGHLVQAAVAHRRATGRTDLLEIARRFADHICDVLGPLEEGKRPGSDGHPEIEMALVELARETSNRRYLQQAKYFLEARGQGLAGGDAYRQDQVPFRELEAMIGHAVRAVYLNAGAADIYAETGDQTLLSALDRLWRSMTMRRMYVTGGIGSRFEGEAFGEDYELPNGRAYAETCAAIGSVMWCWRMLLLTGAARYADLLESTLYNGVLPGIGLDARSYFYMNPLEHDGAYRRQPWFECACCPPNVARLLASLPGYFFSTSDEGIWVHLYAQSSAAFVLPDAGGVQIRQRTGYPWDGDIAIEVEGEGAFTLFVRIPSWCEDDVRLEINGRAFAGEIRAGSYAPIRRQWHPGDVVRLELPMPARLIESHPYVFENAGRHAMQRGPILYCAEEVDNPGFDLRDAILPPQPNIQIEHRREILGGVSVLSTDVEVARPTAHWAERLYRPAPTARPITEDGAARLTLVPYFAWANRTPGRMQVWLRAAPWRGSQPLAEQAGRSRTMT